MVEKAVMNLCDLNEGENIEFEEVLILMQIDELILDEKFKQAELTEQDKKFLEKFTGLKILSLNFIGLKSLKNFPTVNLERLDLNDNSIPGSELVHLKKYTQLKKLKLGNNKINTLKEVEELKSLTELVYLDLNECPVLNKEGDNVEKTCFSLFPKLKALNGYNKDGESVMSSDDEDEEDEDGEFDGEEDDELDDEEDEEFDDESDED